MLLVAGAMREVSNASELGTAVLAVLTQPTLHQQMSSAGAAVIAANRGAQQRMFEQIKGFLESSPPR